MRSSIVTADHPASLLHGSKSAVKRVPLSDVLAFDARRIRVLRPGEAGATA